MVELGRVEPLEPSSVWAHEAHDFTPWLLSNPTPLEDVLGIGIALEESEYRIGGYRLDLLGRDLTHDAVLIVENQLTDSDHLHLGQLITYAGGTDAATIVWIAREFREEHRQAIDWLNSRTTEDVRFFAVRLRVLRIGASLPAPAFELVASPNDWQRQVRSQTAGQRKRVPGGPTSISGSPWTMSDEHLAREIWGKLTPNAQVLISTLLDSPGDRISSVELADVIGAEGAYQVAGSLAWPGIYCRRAGKELFFRFVAGTPTSAATYWVEPDVAEIFNAARNAPDGEPKASR